MIINSHYQYALRLTHTLAKALDLASTTTGIDKSKLIRISIEKFLKELHASGITEAITRIKGN